MMKKSQRIVWITALILMVIPVAGQAGEGMWGIYGGVNFANMGGDMEEFGEQLAIELENVLGGEWTSSKTSRTGLAIGVSHAFVLSPTTGIQLEGLYVQRGVKFDLNTDGLAVDTSFKLSYLEIPVLFRIWPSPQSKTRPVILFGPVVGFQTGADLEVSAMGQSESTSASELFKSTAFGLVIGAGVRVPVSEKNALLFQLRYHLGLTNVLDTDVESSKAGDIMLLGGIEFGTGL